MKNKKDIVNHQEYILGMVCKRLLDVFGFLDKAFFYQELRCILESSTAASTIRGCTETQNSEYAFLSAALCYNVFIIRLTNLGSLVGRALAC